MRRLILGNEAPRHRLDKSAAGEQTASAARTLLLFGEHCARDAVRTRQRRRGHAIEPGDAHDLFNEVGGSMNVGTPRRNADLRGVRLAIYLEAQGPQSLRDFGIGKFDASQLFDAREIERDDPPLDRLFSCDLGFRRLAAAQFQDHVACEVETGTDRGRIDAALEAIARVSHETGFTTRGGRSERIEPGAFD